MSEPTDPYGEGRADPDGRDIDPPDPDGSDVQQSYTGPGGYADFEDREARRGGLQDRPIVPRTRSRSVERQDQPATRSSVGELQDMIEDMILTLENAKSVPLSTSVLVDRESFLDLLEHLRTDLPDELRAARWMVREREAFIARTNERAQEIVSRAQADSKRLVSESYVLAEAVEEANILVRRAEGEARRLRLEAEDVIEQHLDEIGNLMAGLLRQVHEARAELHRARAPAPDVPL